MISTNAIEAPSAVGAFAASGGAAERTTGLPLGTAVRLRRAVDVPTTGLSIGAVQLNSHIPGDPPPRDPLS